MEPERIDIMWNSLYTSILLFKLMSSCKINEVNKLLWWEIIHKQQAKKIRLDWLQL